jgi:starch-binding outer membrane protein, SusD/RagB family
MNKIMIIRIMKIIAIISAFLCFLNSCEKSIEVPPPSDEATSSVVFSNEQAALSAVMGLYYQMSTNGLTFFDGGLSIFPGLSADEFSNTTTSAIYDPFSMDLIPATETTTNLNRLWKWAYSVIYQANAIIEGVKNTNSLTQSVKDQLTAEAKFCRAFTYFYLINLYGEVPLLTSTDYRVTSIAPRTSVPEIYDLIKSDLMSAESVLAETYAGNANVRPTKFAAAALLARVYLFLGDWANAESESGFVINSGNYQLEIGSK